MQIASTRVYLRKVAKLLTEEEREEAEDEIVADPLRWPVIPGTGGIRKARAARGSSGKSGGVRIIFYLWTSGEAVYLLTVYAKNEKSDLTPADKRALRRIVDSLKEQHHG